LGLKFNFELRYSFYWRNNDERNEVLAPQKVLIENNVQTFPFVEKSIGPHPHPMFESHVTTQNTSCN
jgi:hypothetical protein